MTRYRTEIQKISLLSSAQKEALVFLYFQYYSGSDRSVFLRDLAKKDEILLLFFQEKIIGFTTLEYYQIPTPSAFVPEAPYQQAQKLWIIFSGDTIVDKAHWGQQALSFTWIKNLARIKNKHKNLPIYWLLLVKGFRTYRYLAAFVHQFYPGWQQGGDTLKPLADALALEKYATLYNTDTGIIECPSEYGYLNLDVAQPQEKDEKHPACQFFLKQHPNYLLGHEMVCVCSLEFDNLKPLTQRVYLSHCL